MRRRIYAILDRKSQEFLGNAHALTMHAHDAAAVRMFVDACTAEGSMVQRHPDDFELVCLGEVDPAELFLPDNEEGTHLPITPGKVTIITGRQWYDMAIAAERAKGGE